MHTNTVYAIKLTVSKYINFQAAVHGIFPVKMNMNDDNMLTYAPETTKILAYTCIFQNLNIPHQQSIMYVIKRQCS